MTRRTGPDCAVMCNLINTHTHTQFKHRQRERGAESADKVEVAPGVIVASLRRSRAALHGCDPGRVSDGSRLALYQTHFIECPFSIFLWHVLCV